MSEQSDSLDSARQTICRDSFSPLARKIIEVAANDKAPVQSLAAAIASDPLLAMRLLRVVNFATGLPQPVTLLAQAINVLGFDIIKSLALGIGAFSLPQTDHDEIVFEQTPICLRQLFEHSLGCATLAGRIAALFDHTMSYHTFAAAFLHDIGAVLLYRHAAEAFAEAIAVAAEKNIPMSEAETLALGMNHLEIGELWAGQGALPAALRQTVRYHHTTLCLLPDSMPRISRQAIAIVQLANQLCEAAQLGKGGDNVKAVEDLWVEVGLGKQDYADQLTGIKLEIEAARQIFGFPAHTLKRAPAISRSISGRYQDGVSEAEKIAVNGRSRVIRFPSRSDKKAEAAQPSSTKRLKILVVEDHGSLCDMLSLYFMRHGYHVRTANNGEAALEVLANEEIHVVLLDLMLPRLDGFGVLQHLRKRNHSHSPYVIVVSAGASEKDRSKVLELGADEYMPKPFHLMRLLERVQSVEKYLS